MNNLPRVVTQPRPAEDRTRDLLIASPTPCRCATTSPLFDRLRSVRHFIPQASGHQPMASLQSFGRLPQLHQMISRRLYILCWSELSRRRLLPAVSPAAVHLTTPTVAGLSGLCENFLPTTSKSSPILRLLSSHWATSVVRTRVVGVANVGDSLRRLSSLQHRIYNLLSRVK